MILDIHTHILPGMDDGSKGLKQSVTMLRQETAQGVDAVVMTPHFYADRESPERFMQRRLVSENRLKNVMGDKTGIPELRVGAEVAFFDGICRTEAIELLCISGTNAMLIEMPFCKWNKRMIGELEELRYLRRIQPVLAHVERYMQFQSSDAIGQLCDLGMWIQVNTSFILRWQTSMRALSMIKQKSIHFIGSDCHNMQHRAPDMGEAMDKIKRKLGTQSMTYLSRNAERLLEG